MFLFPLYLKVMHALTFTVDYDFTMAWFMRHMKLVNSPRNHIKCDPVNGIILCDK